MKEKKTYYDWLLTKTEKEDELMAQLSAERARFHNTPEYIEHEAKLDNILQELKKAGDERRKEAEKHRKSRKRRVINDDAETRAAIKAEQERKRAERIASYSKGLKDAISLFEGLTEEEKSVFSRETVLPFHNELSNYENPQTTKDDMRELLEILVQTSIDFINERELKDIDAIGFSADSLQTSAKQGEWTPSTDASVHVYGMGKSIGSDGNEYYVEKYIGNYM